MKRNCYRFSVIVALIIALSAHAHAADSKVTASDTKSTSTVAPTKTDPLATTTTDKTTLSSRRAKAVADLQATADALNAIASQVSTTIIHLSGTKISTDTSQTALLKSETHILSATVSLSSLSKAYITGDTIPKDYDIKNVLDEDGVKKSVGAIEDELLLARQGLIDSLTALKTSLSAH